MLWTLWLIFALTTGEPEYVSVEAEDQASCEEQGRVFSGQVEDGGAQVVWFCMSPEGEIVMDGLNTEE